MSQPERLYWIDAQIRDHRYPNTEKVAAHFEVSKRIAYEDRIYLIHRLGAPLIYDLYHGGWAYAYTTFMLPFLALTVRQETAMRRSLMVASPRTHWTEAL